MTVHKLQTTTPPQWRNKPSNKSGQSNNSCPHCTEACDYTHYKRSIRTQFSNNLWNYVSEDEKPFYYNFLFDNILWNQELENFRRTIRPDENDAMRNLQQVSSSLTVVHLRFFRPEIEIADVSYSTWDKFANFGGNFGIFAEITGSSFLGMLNFVFLVIKVATPRIFSKIKRSIQLILKKT